jgi:putative pyruvate formate lyase activating enzyme
LWISIEGIMKAAAHKQAGQRAKKAREALRNCQLCPRDCRVDRTAGERGYCGLDDKLRCFRELVYDGEEKGLNPSYHLCFTGCNLQCEFCTVAEWNEQPLAAPEADYGILKKNIEKKISQGARNLNLLGGEPGVNIFGILELLSRLACETQVIWNSNMYYNDIVTELTEGLVDVYLADLKVGSKRCAEAIIGSADYLEVARRNITRAGRQGRVIVRHVILPGHTECCLKPLLHWLAEKMPRAEVSLKGNYLPPVNAISSPGGYLGKDEFQNALQLAEKLRINLVK